MDPQHKELQALLISYIDAYDEIFESSTASNYWLRSVADSYTDPGQLEALERGDESSVENLLSSITEVKINGELFVEKHPTTKEHWWEALHKIYKKDTESTVRAYSVLFQPERPVDDRLSEFEELILPKLNQIGSGNHKISSNWSQSKFHGITTLLLELFYPDSYVSYKYLRAHRFFDQYFDFSVQNAGQCEVPEQYAKLTEGYEIMNEELSEIYPEANMYDIHAIIYNYGSIKRNGFNKGDINQSLCEEGSQKQHSNSNRASDLPVSVPLFQQLKLEIKQEIQNSDWGEKFFWESPDLGSPYIGPTRGSKDDFIWLGIAHKKMAKSGRPTRGLQFEFGIDTGNKTGFFNRDVICGIYINRRTGEKQLKREISKRLYNHANKFAEKIKNSPYLIYFGNKSFSDPSAEQIRRHAEQVSEGLLITRDISSKDIRKKSNVSKFVISEFLELVPYYGLLADIKELPRLSVIESAESPKLSNTTTEPTDPTLKSIASSSSVFELDSIKRKIDKLLSRGATNEEARSCVAQYVCDRERNEGLYSIPGIGLTVGYELSRRGITSRDQLTSGHLEIIKQIDGISDHHIQPLVEAVEHIDNPDRKKEVRRPLDAETDPPKQDNERDISRQNGVSGSLSPVCSEEVKEGSAPEPNEITELYVAFWSLRTVVENVLADDSTPVSGDSDHPISQYRAMLNKFTWGSSLAKEIIPGYGTLQKEIVPFPHREYREAFGNGDWVTDFQCIDTVLFREDTQERLEEHNIVQDASQYARPVTPESGEPLPEAPMTESELQSALDLLSEFRIVPECPWEVTDLDLDEQPRTATYPMGRLYDAYREEVTRRKASGSKAAEAGSSSTLPAWLESTPAAESSPSNDEEVESFLMQYGKLTHLYRKITPPEDAVVTEPLSIFALNEYHPLTQTESPPEDSFRLYSFAKQEERTHMNHFVERLRDLIYRRVLTATATFDLITVYPGHEAGSISDVLADLARETVKETHIIYADLLERTRTMPRQKTLSRNKRWQIAENPSDHLAAVNRLDGRSVILLDDVCTSGASLSAGAHILRAAGADRVLGVTLGSTHGSREDSIIELSNRARTVSDLEEPQ